MKIKIEFSCIDYTGQLMTVNNIFDCPKRDWNEWLSDTDLSDFMESCNIYTILDWKRLKLRRKKIFMFINGGTGNDHYHFEDKVRENGFKVILIDNLYEKPQRLKQVAKIDPDHLFIFTTGVYVEKIERVVKYFKTMNYTPRNIIAFGQDTQRLMYRLGLKYVDYHDVIPYR